jgi:hypothetical protein
MVRFSTSPRFICGAAGCDCSKDDDAGHAEGCEVAALRPCVSKGVGGPEPAVDAGLDGALDETV